MVKAETELKNAPENLEALNVFKPSLATIRGLKKEGVISELSPFWWSTDYEPDPREYLDLNKFRERLVHLGNCEMHNEFQLSASRVKRDVYLYPKPKVPMALLNLEIAGQTLPFLVTARPYHEKELHSAPLSLFLFKNKDLKKLKDDSRSGKLTISGLQQHFLPHIRGLFAGARKNNLFWYPVHYNSWGDELRDEMTTLGLKMGMKFQDIQNALAEQGLSFIGLYEMPYGERRTYCKVWEELSKTKLVSMNPQWVDFRYSEVSADEFLTDKDKDENLWVYYPIKIPGLKEIMPLAITNRTHRASRNRNPVVLGIYAENLPPGYGFKCGILRIKDPKVAQFISNQISKELGTSVDTVLFTPQKGRPRYDRVSSA